MDVTHEEMNTHFHKRHLVEAGKHIVSLHRFTGIDLGDPHDHPWDFTTHILHGGYVERVFKRHPYRSAYQETFERRAGSSHTVCATDVHQIIELLGECWTAVVAGPKVREPCFWRFDGAVRSRQWNETEWRLEQ